MTRSQTVFLILLICLNQSNSRPSSSNNNSNNIDITTVQVKIGDSVVLPCVFGKEVESHRVLWLQEDRAIGFADLLEGKFKIKIYLM